MSTFYYVQQHLKLYLYFSKNNIHGDHSYLVKYISKYPDVIIIPRAIYYVFIYIDSQIMTTNT